MRLAIPFTLVPALFITACDQLLPDRSPAVVAPPPPAESPAAAHAPPARRRPPPPPDTSGVSQSMAFNQIRRGLRRLVAAEQGFYAENGAYTEDLERLGYRAEGQTTVRFLWLKRDGWAASGTHPALPGRDCVIYVGPVNAAPTTLKHVRYAREGVVACDETLAQRRRGPGAPAAPAPVADTTSALDAVTPTVQMRVDLRNLVLSQNAYRATQGMFSHRTEPLALQYLWHRGVTVTLLSADNQSWAASATHAAWPGKSCVIWFGPVLTRPATQAQGKMAGASGVPACDD